MNVVPLPDRLPAGLEITPQAFIEAVRLHMAGGKDTEVATHLQCEPRFVPTVRLTKEWQRVKQDLLPEIREAQHTQLLAIRDLSSRTLLDRVRDGDPAYDLDGNHVGFNPLKAKELALILGSVTDVIKKLEAELGVVRDSAGNLDKGELLKNLENLAKLERFEQAKEIQA